MPKYTKVETKLDLANNVIMKGDFELPEAHHRMCFRRFNKDWRLRIEDGEGAGDLYHVANFEGDINLNWFDGHSHFFHDGPIYIDENYVAHLKNPVDIELARTDPCNYTGYVEEPDVTPTN